MRSRVLILAFVAAAFVVAGGVVLYRFTQGMVVLVYVLAWTAVLLAILLARVRALLPPAPEFGRLREPKLEEVMPVDEFQTLLRHLRLSRLSSADVHSRLGPVVREIVATRLARHQGVDLVREPDKAQHLLGEGKVWELVRPDPEARPDRFSGGWSRRELEQVLNQLERL